MSREMYNEIKDLYIAAAQKTPENDMDPNVQVTYSNATIGHV